MMIVGEHAGRRFAALVRYTIERRDAGSGAARFWNAVQRAVVTLVYERMIAQPDEQWPVGAKTGNQYRSSARERQTIRPVRAREDDRPPIGRERHVVRFARVGKHCSPRLVDAAHP